MDPEDAFIALGEENEDFASNLDSDKDKSSLGEFAFVLVVVFGVIGYLAYRRWRRGEQREKTLAAFDIPYTDLSTPIINAAV